MKNIQLTSFNSKRLNAFPLRSGKSTDAHSHNFFSLARDPSQCNKVRKQDKRHKNGRERNKPSLLAGDIIMGVGNPDASAKKMLQGEQFCKVA